MNNLNKYAYLDINGILHIAEKEDAQRFSADGKMVPYNGETHAGYPVCDGKDLYVYVTEKGLGAVEINVYTGNNIKEGTKVQLSDYPAIKDLVNKLV